MRVIDANGFTTQQLAASIMDSDEYRALHASQHQPLRISLQGFDIFVNRNDHLIGAAIARSGDYEPWVSEFILDFLEPGMVFMDVGANIGFFSLLASSKLGEEGLVLAFEPNPENLSLFEASVAINGFDNIEILPYAVAEVSGHVHFETASTHSNGRITTSESSGATMVEAIALDELEVRLNRLDLVKNGYRRRRSAGIKRDGSINRHLSTNHRL